MKKLRYIFFLLIFTTGSLWSQTNWQFVGPKSNNQNNNGFETSQFSNITIDPANGLHLFASSWWGGLWESSDRGTNWLPVTTDTIGTNGIAAVCFLSTTEILVGNSFQISRFGPNNDIYRTYSTAVWKFNFSTKKWTSTGTLTNGSSIPFNIRSIATYPGSTLILFVCTTRGLFRSSDGGGTWTLIPTATNYVENIVFTSFGTNSYYCYIAGSTSLGASINGGYDLFPMGTVMVKESSNAGLNFTDLSANFSTPAPYNLKSHAKILGTPANGSHDAQFFLYTLGTNDNGFGDGMEYILTFKKNVITGVLSAYSNLTPNGAGYSGQGAGGTYGSPTRMGFAYDDVNNMLWYGGTKVSYMYIPTPTTQEHMIYRSSHSGSGYIHDDIHDIQIKRYNGQLEMYVAHDAGIVRSIIGSISPGNLPFSPDPTKLYFNILNNGLNVCLLTGFSGTDDDKDLYAVGGHDIVNTDIYDAALGKNRYTIPTWENDGALIDKFDKNKMFFDESQYDGYYATSVDGGNPQNVDHYKSFFSPDATSNVFKKGNSGDNDYAIGFARRLFFQDPYRKGRVFYVKNYRGIFQYVDDVPTYNSAFVNRISPGMLEPTPGAFQIHAWSMPGAMSFSPQTINSLHFGLNGSDISRASVIKYIGNNIDDCWNGHNGTFYTDGSGQHPQWATLTANLWENLGINATDMMGINFLEMETSPWNKDVMYTMVYVPHHPEIVVLKYDGSNWSNYSNGLALSDYGNAMVMDYLSNDELYLSTDKKVYFRNPYSGSWVPFKTGLPLIPSVQMEINYTENTVRAGTYGRGIWKTDLKCPDLSIIAFNNTNIVPGFVQAMALTATNATVTAGKTTFRAATSIILNPKFVADASTGAVFLGYIHGCTDPGNSFVMRNNTSNATPFATAEEEEEDKETETEVNEVNIHPNPSTGVFELTFTELEDAKNIYVYDIMGKLVFKQENMHLAMLQIDITNQPAGMYLVKVISKDDVISKTIIKQ